MTLQAKQEALTAKPLKYAVALIALVFCSPNLLYFNLLEGV